MLTEHQVIAIVRRHLETQFPKTCSCCGLVFDSLAEYVENTTSIGDPVSVDAEARDWRPAEPVGTMAFSNCRCGTTLTLGSDGLSLLTLWSLLGWVRVTTQRRGVTSRQLLGYLRDRIKREIRDETGALRKSG